MAVACAAIAGQTRRPGATILIMPADHAVPDKAAFGKACRSAAALAETGLIMTLGIQPDHPSSALGYIRPGSLINTSNAFHVASFIRQPSEETTKTLVNEGYLLNSGYSYSDRTCWSRNFASSKQASNPPPKQPWLTVRDLDFTRLDLNTFKAAPMMSIDDAVMQRTQRIGVLPVDFTWPDIGTWGAL